MGDRGVELLRSKGYVGVYVSVLEESDNLSFENHPRRVIGVIGIVDQIEKNAEVLKGAYALLSFYIMRPPVINSHFDILFDGRSRQV